MYRYMQSSMFSFIAMHDYTLYKEKSCQLKPIIQGSKPRYHNLFNTCRSLVGICQITDSLLQWVPIESI